LIALAAAFAAQAVLGLPGMWPSAMGLILPMPWVVGPPLLTTDRRWYALSFLLGGLWDVLFEPVVGPGAIAWSCAALVAWTYAGIATDRSPRSWLALGAAAALTVTAVRAASLFPLGIRGFPAWRDVAAAIALTAAWCGLVGWLIALDVPRRWRVYRARTLR
jgi:hypothetical protein